MSRYHNHHTALITALAYIGGTVLGALGTIVPLTVFIAPAAVSLLLKPLRIFFFGILGLCLGFIQTANWRQVYSPKIPLNTPTTIRGPIVVPPDIRSSGTLLTIQPDNHASRILVHAPRYPEYTYGEKVAVSGTLELAEAFEGFNYPLYLLRYRVGAVMHNPRRIERISGSVPLSLQGYLYRLSGSIERTISQALPEPEASFLAGVILGSKRAVPQYIRDSLSATGTSHIIAISGANITILLNLVLSILPVGGLRSRFLITALTATFVTILTGGSASVVRGAVVGTLSSYLKLRSRRAWAIPTIVYSMAGMLTFNPLLLAADSGFQLSFAAFTGLALAGAWATTTIDKLPILRGLPEAVRGALAETAAATIGTIPLSFKLFGQLPLISLIVNPCILWMLPATTALGLTLTTFGWIPGVAALMRIPVWALLHTILSLIEWFSSWADILTIRWESSWSATLGLYAALLLIPSCIKHVARR